MNDTAILVPQMVAAAPAAIRNVRLSSSPRRMTISKVWGAMLRAACQHIESEGFVAFCKGYSGKLRSGVSTSMVRILSQKAIRSCEPFCTNRYSVT